MDNKMGIGRKFAYSFYNFSAYKEFLAQGLSKSILYIFLVTIVFSTLGNITTVAVFNDEISRIENKFNKDAPNFELKDGTFSIDCDSPIYYTYKGDSPILNFFVNGLLINDNLIIDTSGTTDASVLNSYKSGTYINSESVTLKILTKATQTIKFNDYSSLNINNDIIKSNFSILKLSFDFTILFINPIIAVISNLCAVFIILGPLTMLLSKKLKVKLNYTKSCTISFYAMTVPLIIESLLTVTGIYVEGFNFLFYLISLSYCSLAIKKFNKKDDTKLNVFQ